MAESKKKTSIFRIIILTGVWAIVIGGVSGIAYWYSQSMMKKELVYGEWIEVNAPSYDTEVFSITEKGVIKNRRIISSKFDFDGKVISFPYGTEMYSYELHNQDRTVLKRLSPKPSGIYFVKRGHEELFEEKPTDRKRISFR